MILKRYFFLSHIFVEENVAIGLGTHWHRINQAFPDDNI